MRYTDGVA